MVGNLHAGLPGGTERGMTELHTLAAESGAGRLIRDVAEDWQAFTHHRFVEGLADGSLPEHCFRFYLVQDYRFLVHFARAWALVAFKSEEVEEILSAARLVETLIDDELRLHVEICAGWGLDEAELRTTPEHPANAAYTRFVLERGLAGDLADLLVALAPCVVGYGEIGHRLAAAGCGGPANPYAPWIETYSGDAYHSGVAAAVTQLDHVLARRLGPTPWEHPRWADLVATFRTATRLEIGFWEMGLAAR